MLEPFLQVGARNFVIQALIQSEERMHDKPVVFYLFAIYTSIELVRYPYYMLRVYDLELGLLTWLRYNTYSTTTTTNLPRNKVLHCKSPV